MYINVYRTCEIYSTGVKSAMFAGPSSLSSNWMFPRWSTEATIENKALTENKRNIKSNKSQLPSFINGIDDLQQKVNIELPLAPGR